MNIWKSYSMKKIRALTIYVEGRMFTFQCEAWVYGVVGHYYFLYRDGEPDEHDRIRYNEDKEIVL